MKKFGWALLVVIVLTGLTGAVGAGSLPAAFQPYLGGDIPISTLDNEKVAVSVAYNSQHNEYLVVWQNNWGGNKDIYAQRLSASGELLSGFTIATGGDTGGDERDRANPAVAYDPLTNRYLVAYEVDVYKNGSDWDIWYRFVPWDGPHPGYPLSPEYTYLTWPSSHESNPALAYALTQQDFFLVFESSNPESIMGYGIHSDGSSYSGGYISNLDMVEKSHVDVAYNLIANQYLVVWEQADNIYASRINATLSPWIPVNMSLSLNSDDESSPSVATCSSANQYLVIWNRFVGGDNDLYALFVRFDVIGPPEFVFDATSMANEEADVTCNQGGTAYLVSWQDQYNNSEYGIWSRLVYPDYSQGLSFTVMGANGTGNRKNPAVAGGSSNFLTAWEQDRSSYKDVHGRLITVGIVFLPVIRK
jgi:hypothetical protein